MADSRAALIAGIVLALLAALPVIVAAYPQMGDYPAHLARYHVMLEQAHNPVIAGYYKFAWRLTGNLGVDLLVRLIGPVLGVELAGRIIAGIIPVLTGLGILAVEWTLKRRIGIGSYLAFVFIWSPSLLMGFTNFGLSVALALLAFALWVRLESKPWRWALFLPIGMVVWLCHLSGWGVLGLLVLGYEFARRPGIKALLAPLPLALPVIPTLLGGGGTGVTGYGPNPWRYKKAIWSRAMRDRVDWLDHGTLWLIAFVLVVALFWRKLDWRLAAGGLLLLVGAAVLPRQFGGGDYVDFRLIAVSLMVLCLAITWPKAPRLVLWLAPLLFLVRLGYTTVDWQRDSRRMSAMLTMLDAVPRGARIASAIVVPSNRWHLDSFEHICGYAVIRRDALTNCMFAYPGLHLMTLRPHGSWTADDFRDPSHRVTASGRIVDLAAFEPASHADWLWVVREGLAVRLPLGARVVRASRDAVLARLANRPAQL